MATTLKVIEAAPLAYPQIFETAPLAGSLEELLSIAAWQRIESFIGWRWGARDVTFTVEGPGAWEALLQPATFGVFEIWRDDAWEAVTLRPTALGGLLLPELAHYRIAATVGAASDPPRAVKEAVFRLAEYLQAADAMPAGERIVASFKTDLGRPGSYGGDHRSTDLRAVEFSHHGPTWIARAMQNSGAADLLRPWRNLGAA